MSYDEFSHGVTLTTAAESPTVREVWRVTPPSDTVGRPTNFSQNKQNGSFRRNLFLVNLFGVAYYFVFGAVVFAVHIWVTLPSLYPDLSQRYYHQMLYYFLYFNMMLNYVLIFLNSGHSFLLHQRSVLPTHAATMERPYCDTCQRNIPQRGKHCVLCNTCILKRDHHCFFSGCCIGFYNQRFFIVFCFYVFLGCLIAFYVDLEYLRIYYANFYSFEIFKFLLPWCLGEWMFSDLDGGTLAVIFLTYLTFTTGLSCAWFSSQQMYFVYLGQTSYEYVKGTKTYRTKPRDHFRSVFGYFWPFNFIVPMPWFKNIGDGVHWITLKHL